MGPTVGVDIGGTHIRAARVDADGRIAARAVAPSSRDPAEVVARCLALVADVGGGASGIGIGVPGRVDVVTHKVFSGGYVDLSGMDFAAAVEAATGLPVTLDNDAGMALRGEAACGAARGVGNVVMLTIGTGIGGAILDGGRVLRGRGVAGQLGHLVVEPGGRACVCGRRGCVETVSSGTALGVHLAEAGMAGVRVEDLLCREDEAAAGVLRTWAGPLRAAIDSLVAACNPEVVVLGGGLGAAAVAALERVPDAPSWFSARVVAAALGDDAGVIGAAFAARPAGKRAVLVNGVPASGKSGVARALSDRLGWPVLALDTVKGPFFDALGPVDRAGNRRLGQAAYAAMFDLMRDAPDGSAFILDAWFGFQQPEALMSGLARAGVTATAEVWCHAPPEVIGARYVARVDVRPAGHPGREYVPELVALAARAAPMALGPVRRVDTTIPLDVGAMANWLAATLGPR